MLEIPLLVTSALTVLQPLLPVIAAKGAEKLGESAGADLWSAIKNKFEPKEASREALEDLLANPKNEAYQTVFKVQLEKALKQDASFAAQLAGLLLEAAGSDTKGQVIGGGALAQGDHAKAVGAGGIMVDGNLTGNITIGNNNKINTGLK